MMNIFSNNNLETIFYIIFFIAYREMMTTENIDKRLKVSSEKL